MRTASRLRLAGIALLTLVSVAAGSGTAAAYLTAPANGSATAGVGALAPPTLSATPGSEAVELSWSAVAAPGAGAVTYAVSRDGGDPAGDCPSASSPAAVTACTDSGVAPGSHSYTVTARWSSWSVAGEPVEIEVAAGPAVRLVLGADSSTPVAGSADGLTITAEDAAGQPAASYTGTHLLIFAGAAASPGGAVPTVADSSGDAVEFGAATALEFEAGVATVAGARNGAMRLYGAGATSIEASDGSVSTAAPLALTVQAAAPERLAFTNLRVSRGSIGPLCLFTCTVEGLGNRGTVIANVSVADDFGNVVSDLGSGHRAEATASGGSVRRGRLKIASKGPAESTRQFAFRAQSKGPFKNTITAETTRGTPYASATATVSR